MIEFKMPSLGADMEAGTLVEWLVKPGDLVKRGDIIAVVDTQKGLIDIEVFDEGIIHSLQVNENEKVPVGTVLALIASGEESKMKATEAPAKTPLKEEAVQIEKPLTRAEKVKDEAEISTTGEPSAHEVRHTIKASPLAKRIAAQNGIDLEKITGSGEDGAITKDDVEKAMIEKMAPPGGKTSGRQEAEPLEKERISAIDETVVNKEKKSAGTESIRMAVAAAMSKSNREIPHYYLQTKVDMTKALAWLAEANRARSVQQRLLPVVLLLSSVAKGLREVPELNGCWNDGLEIKEDINIGFVVSLRPGGLMIPAIKQVDKKNADELMSLLNDLIPRARAMKLRSSELSESTITITSLGEGNVETVFGIIYPPQVAIVGFGGITEKPWAENGMLAARPVLTVTLAADHRATDGATGSRFLLAVKKWLESPEW